MPDDEFRYTAMIDLVIHDGDGDGLRGVPVGSVEGQGGLGHGDLSIIFACERYGHVPGRLLIQFHGVGARARVCFVSTCATFCQICYLRYGKREGDESKLCGDRQDTDEREDQAEGRGEVPPGFRS